MATTDKIVALRTFTGPLLQNLRTPIQGLLGLSLYHEEL